MYYRMVLLAVLVLVAGGCGERKVDALMQDALAAAQRGDAAGWREAQAKAEECVSQGATGEPILCLYTLALLKNGETDKAAVAASEARQRYPESFLPNYLSGKAFFELGLYRDALPGLRKAHELRGDHSAALVLLTLTAARAGEPEAVALFMELQQQAEYQSAPELYNEWALFYLRQELPSKALDRFNAARQLTEVDPQIYLNMAIVYDHHMTLPRAARTEMARRNYVHFLVESQNRSPDKSRQVQERLRNLNNSRLSQR